MSVPERCVDCACPQPCKELQAYEAFHKMRENPVAFIEAMGWAAEPDYIPLWQRRILESLIGPMGRGNV